MPNLSSKLSPYKGSQPRLGDSKVDPFWLCYGLLISESNHPAIKTKLCWDSVMVGESKLGAPNRQSRPVLYTFGPKVGIIYILGLVGKHPTQKGFGYGKGTLRILPKNHSYVGGSTASAGMSPARAHVTSPGLSCRPAGIRGP